MDRVKAVMDTYDVDVQIYPMVRVSSISGNSSLQQDERSVNTEQGAYIGITEDTYRSLKEALGEKSKDLDLKDGEIYTVYQQNVSMPSRSLDYSGSRTGNYLRFGQPLFYYSVDRKHELSKDIRRPGESGIFSSGCWEKESRSIWLYFLMRNLSADIQRSGRKTRRICQSFGRRKNWLGSNI